MVTNAPTHYEILGVGSQAESETIRKAYRRLARKHHPDVSDSPDAHEDMARINEAFETLIDATRREEYDALLAGAVRETLDDIAPQNPVRIKLLRRMTGHKTPVYSACFEPGTTRLVSSAFDNELIWWNEEGEVARRLKIESGNVTTIQVMDESQVIAAGCTETHVNAWFVEGEEYRAWRSQHEEWVSCVTISPNGRAVASGSVHHNLRVARAETGTQAFNIKCEESGVTAVAFSPDSRLLACGMATAKVQIRDSFSGKVLRTLDKIRSLVTALAIGPDNRYVAVAAVDLSIRVFDLESGTLVKMLYGHGRPIESLTFHPNGWLIASGSRDGTIGLWNAAKGVGNVRIEASSRPIVSVAFSDDGTRLAAAGQDKLIRLFEVTAKLN